MRYITVLVLFLLGCAASTSVAAKGCPSESSLRALSNLGDVYFGEIHGTSETPALIECFIKYRVAHGEVPLIVSLELPVSARNPSDKFWSGRDGRSSSAMWALVRDLVRLEREGRVVLNFQEGKEGFRGSSFDRQVGESLSKLSARGPLVAYGGNFHARRSVPGEKYEVETAGMFVPPSIKLVRVESVVDGAAWGCLENLPCGPFSVNAPHLKGAVAGGMVDGEKYGYDKIYFLKQFTASPPKLSAK